MTSKLFNVGSLLIAALFVVGCGDENPTSEITNRVKAPKLMQTWGGECIESEILQLSGRMFLEFDGNNLKQVHEFYNSSDCNSPAARLVYEGEVNVRDAEPSGAYPLDVTFKKSELVALNETGKDALEAVNFCSVETWNVNQPVTVNQNQNCPLKAMPATEYHRSLVEGDKLFIGEFVLGEGVSEPTERPTISRDSALTKVDRDF